MNGNWKGWEYETKDGLHVYMSKRHYFLDYEPTAICGAIPPKGLKATTFEGDGVCKKCDKWFY